MNGINRVGQKVRCIIESKLAWVILCTDMASARTPVLNEVYTVASFEDCEHMPGIHLVEIASVSCACRGDRALSWPIIGFVPVIEDEKKTDISVFTDLLAPAPKVPEPA